MSLKPSSKLRSTVPFKIKDKDGHNWKAFDLKAQFGFVPEVILISKLHNAKNAFVLSAVLTKEELQKEKAQP